MVIALFTLHNYIRSCGDSVEFDTDEVTRDTRDSCLDDEPDIPHSSSTRDLAEVK